MRLSRSILFASAALCVAALSTPIQAQNFKPTGPALPVDVMSKDWSISGVRISPDGKHIAALAGIPGQNPVIRVWSTDDMSKTPMQFGSKTMRFIGFQFMNNSKLLVFANQPVAAGANSNWFSRAAIANLDGSSFLDISNNQGSSSLDDDFIIGYSLFNRLPKEENTVLMDISRIGGSEIVRLNVNSGRMDRFARTGDNEEFLWSDPDGNIKLKGELKVNNGVYYYVYYFRDTNQSPWRELSGLRYSLNDRFELRPVHISNDNKSIFVIHNRDSNFSVLARYDLETNTLGPPIAQNTEFDVSSASFGAAADEDALTADPLRSFCWAGPATECQYFDPVDKRIQALLERALPDTILNFWSRNGGANVLVQATAPNVPDTFYLLKNERQLIRIGSALEGWDRSKLGPAEWVTYPARDGFQVPGILYLPPGYNKERDGRLPLVVMPHGGPWSRDDMTFDASYWPQMFATRGFAVLLPQYRGSTDLGKALWKGGDKQWGALMQDDKDDGAKWLVEQGIADPNRMMMYGYSYGGFAAAAAATRSSGASAGLWQCAISGAPAIDLQRISNDWGENRIQRTIQGVTVAGFDPFKHLDQVKIPWLVFHGDYDRQADTIHSRTTAARMRQVNPNATFRYVEIPRMAHTLNEMTPEHRTQFLNLILEWMSTNCGNISQTFKEPGLKPTLTKRASK